MKHVWKWLLLALIVAEVVLVRLELLDIGTAVAMVAAVEALILLVAGRQVIVAVRHFKRDREAGLDVWTALEDGLEVFLPRRVALIVALEPKLWFCLCRWLLRRVRMGENDFPYRGRSILGPLLVVVVFTTPVEVFLLELLVPWAWLRWLLLAAAVYLVLWLFALYASLVALPHHLDSSGIRLFYGAFAHAQIGYGNIAGVEVNRRYWPWHHNGLRLTRKEGSAYLAVGGTTDLTIRLRTAQALWGLLGPTPPVTIVHVAADEPERLARELVSRTRMEPDMSLQNEDR